MNTQEIMMKAKMQALADDAMLHDMALDLRNGDPLRFPPVAMADLLDRMREELFAHLT